MSSAPRHAALLDEHLKFALVVWLSPRSASTLEPWAEVLLRSFVIV